MSGEELSFDEYDEIVNTAIKQIYRDNECIALQRIIKKQQKKIEYYKAQDKANVMFVNSHYIHKDKIREKIKEFQEELDEGYLGDDNVRVNKFVIEVLQELLEENKSDENNI